MRFIVLVKGSRDSEAGIMPAPAMFEAMGRFNEEMVAAGIMLSGEGLHPSSNAVRIRFGPQGADTISGPFDEPEKLVSGFWLIEVANRAEAVAWMQRAPFQDGEIELRQVFEAEDFGNDIPPEVREKEQRMRADLSK